MQIIQFLKDHIEYPAGLGAYIVARVSIATLYVEAVNLILAGIISVVFAVITVVVTYFVKRWLKTKYPY